MNMSDYGTEPHQFSNALNALNTLVLISKAKKISGVADTLHPMHEKKYVLPWNGDCMRLEITDLISDIQNHLVANGDETRHESNLPSGEKFVNHLATQHFETGKYFVTFKGRDISFWSWDTLCAQIGDDPLNYVVRRGYNDPKNLAKKNDFRLFRSLWKMLELLQYRAVSVNMDTTTAHTLTEIDRYAIYHALYSYTAYTDGSGGYSTVADNNISQIYSTMSAENRTVSESSARQYNSGSFSLDQWQNTAGWKDPQYNPTDTGVYRTNRLQWNYLLCLRKTFPMENFTLHGQINHTLHNNDGLMNSCAEDKDVTFQNGEAAISHTCCYSRTDPATFYSEEERVFRKGQSVFVWKTNEGEKLQGTLYRFEKTENIS